MKALVSPRNPQLQAATIKLYVVQRTLNVFLASRRRALYRSPPVPAGGMLSKQTSYPAHSLSSNTAYLFIYPSLSEARAFALCSPRFQATCFVFFPNTTRNLSASVLKASCASTEDLWDAVPPQGC